MQERAGLVVVGRFSQPHEAHLARSVLQAAGIEAIVADDHIVAVNWLYSNVVGGVKVLVPVADADMARAVLATPAQVDAEAVAADDLTSLRSEVDRCPKCGSHNLVPTAPGRRLLFLSWLLVGIPIFPVLRRTRCRDCGYRFRMARAAG
jgi:predicted Zn-ribbon and HTH transcriptional regulator